MTVEKSIFANKKHQLFFLQLISHIILIWAIFNFTLIEWGVVFFIYFLTGSLGVSITLHRYYSHKSFEFRNVFIKRLFTIFSFWGCIGDPISWVNNHRQHHRTTDKPGDPHSPKIIGFINSQWFSMYYTYPKIKFVTEMIRDPFLVFLHKNYFYIHITFILIFSLVSFKLLALIYLVPAAILWNAGSLINSIAHLYGVRTHSTNDNSVNNFVLGYLVWGEGWHNNHHNNPKNYTFSEKWWQLDISRYVIDLIKK